ncbi:hypothetical protein HGRIS_012588 [Hohenbuehelia grisea]|uniref:Laccase n=1 Tax=Hohenbuehelia grisea TaxID=104357 RepID=A0ABR3ISQ5_9AGAR
MFSFGPAALFVALAVTRGTTASIGPSADLHITNANLAPDGFRRAVVLAGDTFPGPVVRGKRGDSFAINVINDLTDGTMSKTTSIHWHGLFMKGSNWADGGAMVNQCPIGPRNSFLYSFSVPDQAGTFWYHSHYKTQYCDGLRGAIVIEDPNDPHKSLYDVDDDSTVITLADWYHNVSPVDAQQPLVFPSSTLINGKGRYLLGPQADLAVINVQQGKRYRFRLVSISCDPRFMFSIDGHQLTIIEADGVNTQPLTVDRLDIAAGQRYSVVLTANQRVSNYWIRAEPSFPGPASVPLDPLDKRNKAVLRYVGAPQSDPVSLLAPLGLLSKTLKETDLRPLENPAAPGAPNINGADVNINLVMGISILPSVAWSINGVSFKPPSVPVLLQILSGAQDASALMPQGSIYSLPANKVIQITISQPLLLGGTSEITRATHPFHLHGHSFSVIRSAGSNKYNYANPVRRDVVDTGAIGDNVTIRFVTDNPGPWFLHCHIDWHLEAGLAVIFAEDIPETSAANPVPQSWNDLCTDYGNLQPSDIGAA